MPDLSSDRETNSYRWAEGGRRFVVATDNADQGQECYIDAIGRWHCDHDHVRKVPELQDVYEKVEGWTAQQ